MADRSEQDLVLSKRLIELCDARGFDASALLSRTYNRYVQIRDEHSKITHSVSLGDGIDQIATVLAFNMIGKKLVEAGTEFVRSEDDFPEIAQVVTDLLSDDEPPKTDLH